MAPPTRLTPFRTPSPEPLAGREATTIKRCKFFDLLAREGGQRPLKSILFECGISETCGRNWKQQWLEKGSEAKRRSRPKSAILRRKSKVTKDICKMLVSKSNPVRKDLYETQIEYYNLPVGKRQLQRKLREYIRGGKFYKCAFIKKQISAKNRGERETYGERHLYDPLFGFFDHIVFIDEAHVDPTA
jgi:transposase